MSATAGLAVESIALRRGGAPRGAAGAVVLPAAAEPVEEPLRLAAHQRRREAAGPILAGALPQQPPRHRQAWTHPVAMAAGGVGDRVAGALHLVHHGRSEAPVR